MIALDQRGHGLTGSAAHRPVAPAGFSMDELTADVAAVIGRLRLERPVVAGHSWGAGVALEFVARFPELASGLVFVDGPMQGVAKIFSWDEVKTTMQPPLPRYPSIAHALADSKRDFAEAWADDLQPFVQARVMRDGDAWVLTLTEPVRLALLRGLYDSRPDELWPTVHVPAEVLVAQHSERISRSHEKGLERLREIAPSVEVKRFQTPHDIPLYAPAEVAQEIERVARLASGPPAELGDYQRSTI